MVKDALLIGPSGIGQVHLRELLKKKYQKFILWERNIKEIESKRLNLKYLKKLNY